MWNQRGWKKVQIQLHQAPGQANVWELTAPPVGGEKKGANGKSSGCQMTLIRQVTYANISRVNAAGRSTGERGGKKLGDLGSQRFTLAAALPQLHFWI